MVKDFRYTMPDGSEVEGFQVTDASLFQDELSPDWMTSKMLFTKGNKDSTKAVHWLNIDEVETQIPAYGWVVRQNGVISVVDYTVMEGAAKVVREAIKIPDIAKPLPDKALGLAAKINKQSIEDLREQDVAAVTGANKLRQEMIDSMHPHDAVAGGYEQSVETADDRKPYEKPTLTLKSDNSNLVEIGDQVIFEEMAGPGQLDHTLLEEAREAFKVMASGDPDSGMDILRKALTERADWCDCPPGTCDGDTDSWDCRKNSPLVTR